jgi:hypothetical protein
LFIRTIGIARATIKIGLANLVYNNQTPHLPAASRSCMMGFSYPSDHSTVAK